MLLHPLIREQLVDTRLADLRRDGGLSATRGRYLVAAIATVAVAAAVAVPAALAGGEPKNQAPFTRSAGDRAAAGSHAHAGHARPFTLLVK